MVGLIIMISFIAVLAMCKTCFCRTDVKCCTVTCLCLKLFIILPCWFLRYFKYIKEEPKTNDKEKKANITVVTTQPGKNYYDNPLFNYYEEEDWK